MDEIILHQFPKPSWGIANESPYCLKVETYLRMAKLPYRVKDLVDPKKAPNGKVPYLTFNGEIIPDSSRIIDFLEACSDQPVDKDLTVQQKAQSLVIQRTLEEHMYWVVVHSRFIDNEGVKAFCGPYMKKIPFPNNYLLAARLKRGVKKELWYQGLGRHPVEDMYDLCIKDLDAVANLLSDKPYYFGERPSIIDACIYANFAVILYQPWDNRLSDFVKQKDNINQYCKYMGETFFPEIKRKG